MANRKKYGAELEGRRIQVWWPLDSRFYTCRVLKFNDRTRKHKVKYEDSDEENLDLSKEKWRMVLDAGEEDRKDNLSTGRGGVVGPYPPNRVDEITPVPDGLPPSSHPFPSPGQKRRRGRPRVRMSAEASANTIMQKRGPGRPRSAGSKSVTPVRSQREASPPPPLPEADAEESEDAADNKRARIKEQPPPNAPTAPVGTDVRPETLAVNNETSNALKKLTEKIEELRTNTLEFSGLAQLQGQQGGVANSTQVQTELASAMVTLQKELKMVREQMFLIQQEEAIRRAEMLQLRSDIANYMGQMGALPVQIGFTQGRDPLADQGMAMGNAAPGPGDAENARRQSLGDVSAGVPQPAHSILPAAGQMGNGSDVNETGNGRPLPQNPGGNTTAAIDVDKGKGSRSDTVQNGSGEDKSRSQAFKSTTEKKVSSEYEGTVSEGDEDRHVPRRGRPPKSKSADTRKGATASESTEITKPTESNDISLSTGGMKAHNAQAKQAKTPQPVGKQHAPGQQPYHQAPAQSPLGQQPLSQAHALQPAPKDTRKPPRQAQAPKPIQPHPPAVQNSAKPSPQTQTKAPSKTNSQAAARSKNESMTSAITGPAGAATLATSSSKLSASDEQSAKGTMSTGANAQATTSDPGTTGGMANTAIADTGGKKAVSARPEPFREDSTETGDATTVSMERPRLNAYQTLTKEPKTLKDQRDIAKSLVAISSSLWVVENATEPKDMDYVSWSRDVGKQCMLNVAKILSTFEHVPDAIALLKGKVREEVNEFDWLLAPSRDRHFVKVRGNYSVWKPPLTEAEWARERVLLKGIQLRFFRGVTDQKNLDESLMEPPQEPHIAPIHMGIQISRLAAAAELDEKEITKIRHMDDRAKQFQIVPAPEAKALPSMET